MKNEKLISLSLIFLSLSILFASIWVTYQMKSTFTKPYSDGRVTFDQTILTEKEAARILNLSIEVFRDMVNSQEFDRIKQGSYDTYQFIPFFEIDGKRYFSIESILLKQMCTLSFESRAKEKLPPLILSTSSMTHTPETLLAYLRS